MLKKQIVYIIISLCLAVIAFAQTPQAPQTPIPFSIEGRIGDYAMGSREYEVNRDFYKFPANIIIQNQNGNNLSFRHLTGGKLIRIIGEKTIALNQAEIITYTKIIILD